LIGRIGINEDNIAGFLGAINSFGSMASQNANAVAISGGFAELTYERERVAALGNVNAAVSIDWKAQGIVMLTVNGAGAAFTYTNLPAGGNGGMGGGLLFKVVNGGLATNLFGTVRKPAGFSLSSAAVDWVSMVCADGVMPEIIGVTKAVA
jgi:hypothetical protein